MAEIVILGIFVADAAFRADRLPAMGETLIGHEMRLGPGGKGLNQAVGCGRLGADVALMTKVGQDAFGDLARETWADAGVTPVEMPAPGQATGAAFVFVEAASGENAIIVAPGAAATITPEDVAAEAARIRAARVFMTQLEQPLAAASEGLRIARAAGTTTILNPAPATALPNGLLALCDVVTPNEHEAAALTGVEVSSEAGACAAAARLCAMGATTVVMTLGARGALLHDGAVSEVVPAYPAEAVDTTGAGDAFNAGLAVALARGLPIREAVRMGTAVAALAVGRPGAAAAMPERAEVDALLRS